jgi:hypothetical protein
MIRHYLTVAFRHIVRGKMFSFINILGLALGMACSLLIGLWIHDETRVDAFHENSKQLYRVVTRGYTGDGSVQAYPYTQGLLYEELKKKMPEVVHACAFSWETKTVLTVGDKIFMETGRFASEDFFQMFSFPLLYGNSTLALSTPTGITISVQLANKYFGSREAAIGKTIRVDNRKDFQVTAIFETIPAVPPFSLTMYYPGLIL